MKTWVLNVLLALACVFGLAAAATVALSSSSGSASSEIISGSSSGILYGLESGSLVMVNPSSSVVTSIGQTGFVTTSGLAVDQSGSLFTTHNDPDKPSHQLIKISASTGLGTPVGADNPVLRSVSGLAFDSSGTLFAVTFSNELITVNPLTGATSSVGAIPIPAHAHIEDIAFAPSGMLLGVTVNPGDPTQGIPGTPPELITINPSTGLAATVGTLQTASVAGIAFGSSGTLFGVTCELNPKLVTIEPTTCVITEIGSLISPGTCVKDLAVIQSPEIGGYVHDGHAHRLSHVPVTLLGPSTISTTTDDDGVYSFGTTSAIAPGTYQVVVGLECRDTDLASPTFAVQYRDGPTVYAETPSFQVSQGMKIVKDVSFADTSLQPGNGVPLDRLDDLAAMYFHSKQVVDFNRMELGVSLNLDLPIEIHAYCLDRWWTPTIDESSTAYYDTAGDEIYIGENISDYGNFHRPMNREWHELFHELMDDTVGIPPLIPLLEQNHGGYNNLRTTDSWIEGWAEFWPCVLNLTLGSDDWFLYVGVISLEDNWVVWDTATGSDGQVYSREEFAVASLLIDLVDPVNYGEGDFVGVAFTDLWQLIGTQQLTHMRDVYLALVDAGIGSPDSDVDGISNLDEIFIMHGFYSDDDGDHAFDPGEQVGWGGRPGRTNTPLIPGAYVRVEAVDSSGNPLNSAKLVVEVSFPTSEDVFNYDFEVELHESDSLVYLEVAPPRMNCTIDMRIVDDYGTSSDRLVLSNKAYWEFVAEASAGHACEHEFIIGNTGETTVLASLDFDPDVLALSAPLNFVTTYIELPTGYDVSQIDISTFLLNETVPALSKPTKVRDHDEDGIPDLMIKFDAADVQSILSPGDEVEILISGEVDGIRFEGTDTIRVIDAGVPVTAGITGGIPYLNYVVAGLGGCLLIAFVMIFYFSRGRFILT